MSKDKPTGEKNLSSNNLLRKLSSGQQWRTCQYLGIWHLLAWFQMALVAFLFPGVGDGMEGILTISRYSGGLPRMSMGSHEDCQTGARPFGAFWGVQAGQQAGRLAPTGISSGQHLGRGVLAQGKHKNPLSCCFCSAAP